MVVLLVVQLGIGLAVPMVGALAELKDATMVVWRGPQKAVLWDAMMGAMMVAMMVVQMGIPMGL